jgi:ABC-2 type transport system permease protein
MNPLLVVAERELRALVRTPSALLAGIMIAVFLGLVPLMTTEAAEFEQVLFLQAPVLTAFIGYLFTGQAFLREKQEGSLETVLSAPLSLFDLWAGKAIGVAAPAYALSLGCILVAFGLKLPAMATSLPSGTMLVHVFVMTPLVTLAAVGLLGLLQLLLGMRENQIMNMGVVILLIVMITVARAFVGDVVTWGAELGALGLAGMLLALLVAGTRLLDRERIVRTIA